MLLRPFKGLSLSYNQNLQIKALLISILANNSEPKVTDLCPNKFGSDIIIYILLDYWLFTLTIRANNLVIQCHRKI